MKTMKNKRQWLLAAWCVAASFHAVAYDWNTDLRHRLLCDFTRTRQETMDYIRQYIPHVNDSCMAHWERSGALEQMAIDGEKRYFHAAARNLFRIDPWCAQVWQKAHPEEPLSASQIAIMKNVPQILRDAPGHPQHLAQARRMRVTYTLTVKADAVPAGQTLRCWLPFPRTDQPRQQDVELLEVSQPRYKRSSASCAHSTIYMEQKAVAGKPTVFSETFEYTSRGAWFDLSAVQPYQTRSKLYKEYTAERDRHIRFTPELCQLADSLTRGVDNPVEQAQRIFTYISRHFPWASAREYSTIDNIPMYVLRNRHGDCGQVSLLFITLCRICGIPAHFQSGFMMHPFGHNLHDWAEVYFEGVGWVPVDQSFGICEYATSQTERLFYMGGIDSWRMIVNTDYGMPLSPKKKYPRSETVDFQRGEVEWKKGNLYFDQWDWDIQIAYLD